MAVVKMDRLGGDHREKKHGFVLQLVSVFVVIINRKRRFERNAGKVKEEDWAGTFWKGEGDGGASPIEG